MKEVTIADYLGVGKENAISWQELVNLLSVNSRRELYRLIENERKNGTVILSDYNGGYYIPDSKTPEGREEIEKFINKFSAMAKNIFGDLKGARAALKDIDKGKE